LRHKARDDTVEDNAVIKPAIGKLGDARNMVWRKVWQKLYFNLTFGGFEKQG
jgi:hypothetical protein